MEIKNEKFEFTLGLQRYLVIGVLIGLLSFVIGYMSSPQRAWINYLVNLFYFVSLGLSGGVLVAIASITNASWLTPYKRIPETFTRFLPVGFLLGLGLFFGVHTLYEWSHHSVVENDPILLGKSIYLNTPFFMARLAGFFFLWIVLTKIIRKISEEQDRTGEVRLTQKLTKWSALFLIAFAFTYTFASFDWLMSLRPHWFSTIFAIYNFSGLIVNGFACVTLTILFLHERGLLTNVVSEEHLHDLGKFLFGFTTFWAYIWICQYLLIWYANIPEETGYYLGRLEHTWDWLFYFNLAINWIVPFFALMTSQSKRSVFVLKRICILLIIGHWLDIYLMVAPEVFHHAGITNPQIGFVEIGTSVGFMCLFYLIVGRAFTKINLVAKNDPYLEEGINFHQPL